MKALLFITVFTLTFFGFKIIGPIEANRGPAVTPFQEVELEQNLQNTKEGFNFNNQKTVKASRFPANKNFDQSTSPSYYLGPLLFLIALPLTFWIFVSKKLNSKDDENKEGKFFSKTYQFKPFQTEYQKNDDVDDDEDLPKAS